MSIFDFDTWSNSSLNDELSIITSLTDDELTERAKLIFGDPQDWDWDDYDRVDDYSTECGMSYYSQNGWQINATGYYTCGEISDITVNWESPDGRHGSF